MEESTLGTWIILVVVYFLPTLMAYARNKHKANGTFDVNLILGWTLIGWIAAFIMACCIEPKDEYLARMKQIGIKK